MIGEGGAAEFERGLRQARAAARLLLAALVAAVAAAIALLLPGADRAATARWWGVVVVISAVAGIAVVIRLIAERRLRTARAVEIADLRDGLENMADGLLIWDRERRVIGWNERLFEMMPHLRGMLVRGLDAHRLAWKSVRAAHPEWDETRQREWVAERVRQFERIDWQMILPLDGERHIEVTQRRAAAGGVVLLYRDVTEREASMRRLAESEERFRDALDSMGEGIALWDRDGRLLLWNARYLELLPNVAPHARVGIGLAELNRLAARTAYPHWNEAQIDELVERRLRARRELGVPFELVFDDGRVVEIVDHRTSAGGHVSIFRDVTAARRAAAELAASEARFRDGIESMADGFLMWDAEDRLIAWNEQVARLLPYLRPFLRQGTERREAIRGAISFAQPGWSEEQRTAWVEQRLASLGDPSFKPPLMRTTEGRVIEMTDRPTTAGGNVTLYRDVTERERHAAELERALQVEREANLQQRRFIAVASHEFRTPLAIIDGATQRVIARLKGADVEIVRRLHRIRAAVARMTGLIEVTLSSARLEAGQLDLKPSTFDLAALLSELREHQRSVTPDFAIEIEGAERPLAIEADQQLIEQALGNILGNAVKYSGSARRVVIRLTRGADDVAVAVRDHGVGIPSQELPQLFTRFFRASTSRSVAGTGIGLHFAREIAALHGGDISVASEVGAGSTFTLRLPLRFAGRMPAAAD